MALQTPPSIEGSPQPSFKPNPGQELATELLSGDQRHTLLFGGSRSGKTFWLTRAMVLRAIRAPYSRHAILRLRSNAARSAISLDTLPNVMRTCFPQVPFKEHRQDGFFEINESQIWIGGLDDKERVEKILGQEYLTLYFNECSQIPYRSILIALTRLAQKFPNILQRAYYDLNPVGQAHWSYQLFVKHIDPETKRPLRNPNDYQSMFLNPSQNAANLSREYLESLQDLPARQKRRFFDGQYASEIDGALWTLESIEQTRVEQYRVPDLKRIVVAVDPSGARDQEDSTRDAIGIIVAGLGADGHTYVLADYTLRDSPAKWGKKAVAAYHKYNADAIIGEVNYGGAMVSYVIKTTDENVHYKEVSASRGKVLRAEPVAALYECSEKYPNGRVHHVIDPNKEDGFRDLEDELSNFSTTGYLGEDSPNRADALVWAVTELMLGQSGQQWADYYKKLSIQVKEDRPPLSKEGLRKPQANPDHPPEPLGPLNLRAPRPHQNFMPRQGTYYYSDIDGIILNVDRRDEIVLKNLGCIEV